MKYLLLVRHLPVDYPDDRIPGNAFSHYVSLYDASPVIKEGLDQDIDRVRNELASLGTYIPVSSSLSRAIGTNATVRGKDCQNHDLFNEVRFDQLRIPFVKLRFSHWLVVNRLYGVIRGKFCSGIHRDEMARLNAACEALSRLLDQNNICLFGHGFANHMIRKLMVRKFGCQKVRDTGNSNLSIKILGR